MSENVSEGTDNVYKEDCYVDVENNNDCLYLGSNDQRNIHAKPFFPNFVPSQERNSTELLNMRIQPNQIPNNIYSFQPTESTLGFSYPQETSVYLAGIEIYDIKKVIFKFRLSKERKLTKHLQK